mmetsp:Transcript_28317/g.71034  ORF Transcript_28317/g.71034 Transcript_28317/m.71034 type:complete len:223 (-) Transcript_28317:590-1258(-)
MVPIGLQMQQHPMTLSRLRICRHVQECPLIERPPNQNLRIAFFPRPRQNYRNQNVLARLGRLAVLRDRRKHVVFARGEHLGAGRAHEEEIVALRVSARQRVLAAREPGGPVDDEFDFVPPGRDVNDCGVLLPRSVDAEERNAVRPGPGRTADGHRTARIFPLHEHRIYLLRLTRRDIVRGVIDTHQLLVDALIIPAQDRFERQDDRGMSRQIHHQKLGAQSR